MKMIKDRSNSDKNIDIKSLAMWIGSQLKKCKNKLEIMKDVEIYNIWTNFINDPLYKKYFESNEDIWYEKLNKVIEYININNKRPSSHDNNEEVILLGRWLVQTQLNYNKKQNIMLNKEIYNKWTEFINNTQYKIYFQSNEDIWYTKLNEVIQYIDNNNKRPSQDSKINEIKILGKWISTQLSSYKNKEQIMKNKDIYNKWTEFINDPKYKKYF